MFYSLICLSLCSEAPPEHPESYCCSPSPAYKFQAVGSVTEAGHTLNPAERHAARITHGACSQHAWDQQDQLVVSVMVAIKSPQLPLRLYSREQQALPTCRSFRRAHTSGICTVGFCMSWYPLETREKSKWREQRQSPAHRKGHPLHSHRHALGQGAAPWICIWLGGKKWDTKGEKANLEVR